MLNMYFDEQVGAGAPLDEGFASVKPIIMLQNYYPFYLTISLLSGFSHKLTI